jgi:hypothetical protein
MHSGGTLVNEIASTGSCSARMRGGNVKALFVLATFKGDKMAKVLFLLFLSIAAVLLLSCTSSKGNNIAILGSGGIYVGVGTSTPYQYAIFVDLKSANSVAPGDYDVDLYQNGAFRATTLLALTQSQIDAQSIVKVFFPASADEYNTYLTKNIKNIFNIKVHDLTQEQIEQMQQ